MNVELLLLLEFPLPSSFSLLAT